jgi:hypothetical protein
MKNILILYKILLFTLIISHSGFTSASQREQSLGGMPRKTNIPHIRRSGSSGTESMPITPRHANSQKDTIDRRDSTDGDRILLDQYPPVTKSIIIAERNVEPFIQ